MAKKIYTKCSRCTAGTVTQHLENGDIDSSCPNCNGTGFVLWGGMKLDELDDILDKCNDILDKCNDILEKLDE